MNPGGQSDIFCSLQLFEFWTLPFIFLFGGGLLHVYFFTPREFWHIVYKFSILHLLQSESTEFDDRGLAGTQVLTFSSSTLKDYEPLCVWIIGNIVAVRLLCTHGCFMHFELALSHFVSLTCILYSYSWQCFIKLCHFEENRKGPHTETTAKYSIAQGFFTLYIAYCLLAD